MEEKGEVRWMNTLAKDILMGAILMRRGRPAIARICIGTVFNWVDAKSLVATGLQVLLVAAQK